LHGFHKHIPVQHVQGDGCYVLCTFYGHHTDDIKFRELNSANITRAQMEKLSYRLTVMR